jgi:phosphatidylinositol glycan class N
LQKSPWSYYLYIAFPTYFWSNFLREGVPYLLLPDVKTRLVGGLKRNLIEIVLAIGVLLAIAVCFFFLFIMVTENDWKMGYTHRVIWSLGCLAVSSCWLLEKNGRERLRRLVPRSLVFWYILCGLCSVFPLVPVDRSENTFFMLVPFFFFLFSDDLCLL